jgi:hypothetical protein
LSSIVPYAALAIFPVAFALGFSFNPPEFFWAVHHGSKPMPEKVLAKAVTFRRYANFLGDALILCFVAALVSSNSVAPAGIGLRLDSWKLNAAIGVTVGVMLAGVQALLIKSTSRGPSGPFAYHARRGSVWLWLLIFLSGAFSEELWIAFCIAVLGAAGHSVVTSIGLTATVFGVVHYGYGPGGAVAAALKGVVSALLFLLCGSLIPMFLFHFIGNISSLYWSRYRAGGAPSGWFTT